MNAIKSKIGSDRTKLTNALSTGTSTTMNGANTRLSMDIRPSIIELVPKPTKVANHCYGKIPTIQTNPSTDPR